MLQTTLTAWALPYDILIFTSWYQASTEWSSDSRWYLFTFLILWTYGFSKTVKLWGHFFRYPADVVYMPLYIAFGYFHGLIKLYGAFTLSEVGSVPFPIRVGERGGGMTRFFIIADRLFRQHGAAGTEPTPTTAYV